MTQHSVTTIIVFGKELNLEGPTAFDEQILKSVLNEVDSSALQQLEQTPYSLKQEGEKAVFYRTDAQFG